MEREQFALVGVVGLAVSTGGKSMQGDSHSSKPLPAVHDGPARTAQPIRKNGIGWVGNCLSQTGVRQNELEIASAKLFEDALHR